MAVMRSVRNRPAAWRGEASFCQRLSSVESARVLAILSVPNPKSLTNLSIVSQRYDGCAIYAQGSSLGQHKGVIAQSVIHDSPLSCRCRKFVARDKKSIYSISWVFHVRCGKFKKFGGVLGLTALTVCLEYGVWNYSSLILVNASCQPCPILRVGAAKLKSDLQTTKWINCTLGPPQFCSSPQSLILRRAQVKVQFFPVECF